MKQDNKDSLGARQKKYEKWRKPPAGGQSHNGRQDVGETGKKTASFIIFNKKCFKNIL